MKVDCRESRPQSDGEAMLGGEQIWLGAVVGAHAGLEEGTACKYLKTR